MANLYASRVQLQTAADQAAHAAIYNRNRNFMTEDEAKQEALTVISSLVPSERYGDTLSKGNIEFGIWDAEKRAFTAMPGSRAAVRVKTNFLEANDNAVKSYLFKLVGFDQFDIITSSTYTSYLPGCLNEGFLAEGVVDLQSNNTYSNGFCIHSNTHVSLNSNNTFDAGTVVSMPDLDNLGLPQSGFSTNDGLEAALRSASMNLNILNDVEKMMTAFKTYSIEADTYIYPDTSTVEGAAMNDRPDYTRVNPKYITSDTVIDLSVTASGVITANELTPGRIHLISCDGPRLNINGTAAPISEVVIVSPCEIKFAAGSKIQDAIVATTDISDTSMNAPAELILGHSDDCAEGGEVLLLSLGGMSFAADLHLYGARLIALGPIKFAANADGLHGASMISAKTIEGTSNMNMRLCDGGMDEPSQLPYYRMTL